MLHSEAAGPAINDASSPLYGGVMGPNPLLATRQAVGIALDMAREQLAPAMPLCIRVYVDRAYAVAGMAPVGQGFDSDNRMRAKWRAATATRRVWLAGWEADRGYWWAERASELARQCHTAAWGNPPAAWAQHTRLQQLDGDGDECPVCYEDYTDLLPRPDGLAVVARGAPDMFACGLHATCVTCDRHAQLAVSGHRCHMCRANRTRWTDAHNP